MAWNGMFKKFNRKTVTDTDVVVQRDISAGGDVTGIREVAPEDEVDRERFDVVTESNLRLRDENARLVKEVEKLRKRLGEEFDRGYLAGFKRAWNLVVDLEGRPGKRQIADKLRDEIAKAEGRNHD